MSSFGFIASTHPFLSQHTLLIHKPSFVGTVRAFEPIGDGSPSIGEAALAIDKDLQRLIREMSLTNPLWGAPRIHGEQDFPGKSGGTFDSVS